MVRLAFYTIAENGDKIVNSISSPIEESKITPELLSSAGILRNFEGLKTPQVSGKKTILKYNSDLEIIEYIFEDLPREELPLPDRLKLIEEAGDKLKEMIEERFKEVFEQIDLSHEGILELMDRIGGFVGGLFRNN